MTALFKNILIPVDFSMGTEIAVKKALGFMEKEGGAIHLLHVIRPPWIPLAFLFRNSRRTKRTRKYRVWEAEKRLMQWKQRIEDTQPGVSVKIHVLTGEPVRQAIIGSAAELNPDLIIIGREGDRISFPLSQGIAPGDIAAKSHCPVLTAKPGSFHGRIRIIVVPVGNFVPERKLELATRIARKNKARIHLVSLPGDNEMEKTRLSQAFVKTIHRLKEEFRHPIEFQAVGKDEPARTTLAYAESILADIILVNPKTESSFTSLTGRGHLSDLLNRDSQIQILDIQPYE